MSEDCCDTTAEGNTFCVASGPEKQTGCSCSLKLNENVQAAAVSAQTATGFWPKIRGGLIFVVACLTSPCCTPLYVPLGLALLAGTPAAAWLAYHLSWVYGALTLVSIISFILGWRWLWRKEPAQRLYGEKNALEENPQRPDVWVSFDH